jgi:AcrR family transcriptional regulator
MPGNRAVTDEQKAIRQQHIIDAASRLFATSDFKHITMAEIARHAGLAKGTLFLYFKTKEAVFLSLAQQQIEEWFVRLDGKLERLVRSGSGAGTKKLVDLLISSLDNDVLIRLLVILDDTLEQNIEPANEIAFKLFLKARIIRSGNLIERLLPDLEKGEGAKLFHLSFMCLVGAYKVCNPSNAMRAVIEQPGLEMFNRDFKETLSEIITYLIWGFRTSKLA